MDSCCRISIQWQKTCSNRKDTIWVKLWKASIERWPCGIVRDSKSGRVSCRITKELGTGYKGNRRGMEEHEKAIWQKKAKSSRTEDNMWLENKNIQLNWPLRKLDNKRYRAFKISKDIDLGAFQLELPKGWVIHNVFNEDLLTQYMEPKFKGQHEELAPLPMIINK